MLGCICATNDSDDAVRFIDLFAGLGGFHLALARLGHECVFVSEIDDELRELYGANFPGSAHLLHGDIRKAHRHVPPHDILAAGFPCQPFSKSGKQHGRLDRTRGTLFKQILKILEVHKPRFVLLENVGNFERHNGGNTWMVIRRELKKCGYNVRGTTHVADGGHGLISPHHFGYPQTRERFFIVASTKPLADDPFPIRDETQVTSLDRIVIPEHELTAAEKTETALTASQLDCINHWNAFVQAIPEETPLPSFPLWGDEFGAKYPYQHHPPAKASRQELLRTIPHRKFLPNPRKAQLLTLLPAYATRSAEPFPDWKIRFIQQNRKYYREIQRHLPRGWKRGLSRFPASLRKLEWNCNGESRDLWTCVLQFRPSGLRAKRYTSSPALVAMTATQIPILGPERRFLTRREGLRLQGFQDTHRLPRSREQAFAALGNAVHTEVAYAIAKCLLGPCSKPAALTFVRKAHRGHAVSKSASR